MQQMRLSLIQTLAINFLYWFILISTETKDYIGGLAIFLSFNVFIQILNSADGGLSR
jgi:hypothetical protein